MNSEDNSDTDYEQTLRIEPSSGYDSNSYLSAEQIKDQARDTFATPVEQYRGIIIPSPTALVQLYQPTVMLPSIKNSQRVREQAALMVDAQRTFHVRLIIYIAVMLTFAILWLVDFVANDSTVYFWPIWIAAIWGLILFTSYRRMMRLADSLSDADEEEQGNGDIRRGLSNQVLTERIRETRGVGDPTKIGSGLAATNRWEQEQQFHRDRWDR